MTRNLGATCILLFVLTLGASAQIATSSAAGTTHYTQAQLKQMVKDAHAPNQFAALSSYYTAEQTDYLTKADAERQEWIRRSQNVMVAAAKYPRPVDSARYLYEYYTYKALESGQLAAKYRILAAPEAPAVVK